MKYKIYIISMSILFLIISSIILFSGIFTFAVASYTSVCNPEKLDSKYITLGSTTTTYDSGEVQTSIQIGDIEFGSELYREVMQHEKCHVAQSNRLLRMPSCNNPIRKILTEVECYSVDNLPANIYNLIY